jgi:DNA-3-methyladenine glycosylase
VKLPLSFYRRDDVVRISRELLGKVLYTELRGVVSAAIITETEAYAGATDRASHAHGGRRTSRTEPMFGPGGLAYVYLCYGIHHLFNVVVGSVDQPLAILIRAGQAVVGVDTILERRKKQHLDAALLSGPGRLAQGLGITTELTGTSLVDGCIWLEDRNVALRPQDIIAGPRVGVDYAGNDAALPYRFRILYSDDVPLQSG